MSAEGYGKITDPRVLRTGVIDQSETLTSVSETIPSIILTKKFGKGWILGLLASFLVLMLLLQSIGWLLINGIGIWGNNQPVSWAFDIINFVWWIGIGHAGTLISAILLLLAQQWRMSIARFAEAMTIFAVSCAGLFPLLHTGRPWFDYWLLPYPNMIGIWPQFRSPLMWDVFAVSTYATVSLLFWLVGLIPDFATMRDRAKDPIAKRVWGLVALGWRGSNREWVNYEWACILLAAMSTPLVLSVHTIVSFDFAVGVVPGWHSTIFPPYFVAGAIFAGFAMVLTLVIPVRAIYGLHAYITQRHIDNMAKITLATGLIVFYGYANEVFFAWYSGVHWERYMIWDNRMTGHYAWSFWALILCNGLIPQLLWSRRIRNNLLLLWIICQFVSIGMWLERFVIIVTSLSFDFLPSSWALYSPTKWDFGMFIGTMGLFMTLMMLFIRFVPMLAMFELKTLLPAAKVKKSEDHTHA